MPKKRQTAKQLFKPPQTARHLPATTAASDSSSSQNRSVNELLAGLRRLAIDGSAVDRSALPSHERTLPPEVRQILQIPEMPPPRPRRPVGVGGRRAPAGPPPPRSWQTGSANWRTGGRSVAGSVLGSVSGATGSGAAQIDAFQDPLPGTYHPQHGSLVDMALRVMAHDWEFQASYNRFHLHALSSLLKVSLIRYVSLWGSHGVTARDLRLILVGPSQEELAEYGVEDAPVSLNHDVFQLDLTGSPGRSIKIKELAEVLFPSRQAREESAEPLDSWETASPLQAPLPILLPNLTHLSLGIMPLATSALTPTPHGAPSWQELLTHAHKLSALTHLSLAHWPVPSRTQNAKLASVVAASSSGSSLSMQYGGTGPYSHTLDDDFSEAVSVMRHLSKALYRLEHLDLTGCSSSWCVEALTRADAAGNMVDWRRDWGQLTVLRVGSGEVGREQRSVVLAPADVGASLLSRSDAQRVTGARRIERHVIARRSGVGRPISVEADWEDDDITQAMGFLSM